MAQARTDDKLTPFISPAGAWAMALGTSLGWGSLVVTSNTYLAQAGPAGSALGMVVGMVIMLFISHSYAYLMERFPSAGGAYTYCREAFGHDQGFLAAWFLALTYLAMLWANATALPLFARYFLGDIFRWGKLYTLFSYDVYLGEALLTILAILVFSLFCSRYRRAAAHMMLGMVLLFTAGILVCFAAAMLRHGAAFEPAYVPQKGALSQIVGISVISPWAFIGFENVSHASEEFRFRQTKLFRLLAVSVVTTTILYIAVTLLSATAYPDRYATWLDYIRDIGNLQGIEGLPAFYAANHYLGRFGVSALMMALLCLVFTSFIGNITALSRLFYALGQDRILPARYGRLSERGVPANAVLLIAAISVAVPFVGRTAIGWIVDVTTLGATLIYGFVSAAAWKTARFRRDTAEAHIGMIGLVLMIGFAAYLLLPNLLSVGAIANESYFLFVIWSVFGFIFFRALLQRDREKRFGQSIIVWVSLLSLILFVSLTWMSESITVATEQSLGTLEAYYTRTVPDTHSAIITEQMRAMHAVSTRGILVVVGLFALSVGVLLNNYNTMSRRARASEKQLGIAQDAANRDPLTGVKSRHAFTELERDIDEQIETGEARPFALAVCDVNNLKRINDTQGHKAGDEWIKRACTMVCEIFQHSPVYRIGGDEFAVALTERDYEARDDLMAELREKSEAHIKSGDVVVACGLSAFKAEQDMLFQAVFERADERMYADKQRLKAMDART